MLAKFLYRKSDGRFIGGGFVDVQPPMVAGPNDAQGNPTHVPDWANYGVALFGDADLPDLQRHRYDASTGKRLATAPELAAAATADNTATYTGISRQIDTLAMIAWSIRRQNVASWNALTTAQKKAAVLAEADNWRDLRAAIEQVVA